MAKTLSWAAHLKGRGESEARDISFPAGDPPIVIGSWPSRVGAGLFFAFFVLFIMRNLGGAAKGTVVGGGEIESWLWRYWWLKEVLSEAFTQGGWLYGLRVFFSAGSYPEYGNVLDLQLISYPLEYLVGMPLCYNLKVFLVIWFNCLACWWFLTRTWGPGTGAWIGGLLYGLNPFFLNEISCGRVRQAVAFAIPLFMLHLYRSWRTGSQSDTLLAGLFWGITSAFYLYYGLFVGFFWLLVLGWHLVFGRQHAHMSGFVGRMLFMALVAMVVVTPFVAHYGSQVREGRLSGIVSYGTSLPRPEIVGHKPANTAVLAPLEQWHKRFVKGALPLNSLWSVHSAQALPLAIVLLVFLPGSINKRWPWLWLAAFAGFFVLCLGPYLMVNDLTREYVANQALPYAYLYKWLPGFSRLFAPQQLAVMVYLSLAVLLCIRVHESSFRTRDYVAMAAFASGIFFIVQLEYAQVSPLSTVQVDTAPLFYVLGEQRGDDMIDVPLGIGNYLKFNQTVHGQRSLGLVEAPALPSGLSGGKAAELANCPVPSSNKFVSFLKSINYSYSTAGKKYSAADVGALRKQGYKLLVLHERGCQILDGKQGTLIYFRLLAYFRQQFGEPIIYGDEPVYAGLEGRATGDERSPVWCRMAVFSLEGPGTSAKKVSKQDRKAIK